MWLQVPELTENRQVHIHAIVAGLETKYTEGFWRSKKGRRTYISFAWFALREAWYQVTGDSFVVDLRRVRGPVGASAYIGKYLGKQMYAVDEMERRGFRRRWTRSRNWPTADPLRFDIEWVKSEHTVGLIPEDILPKLGTVGLEGIDIVGDPVVLSLREKKLKYRKQKELEDIGSHIFS